MPRMKGRKEVFAAWWRQCPFRKMRIARGLNHRAVEKLLRWEHADEKLKWRSSYIKAVEMGREGPTGKFLMASAEFYQVPFQKLVKDFIDWNMKRPLEHDLFFLTQDMWMLGCPLRIRRQGLRLTMARMAQLTGVPYPTITNWERALTWPAWPRLAIVAKVLGCPFGKLCEEYLEWRYPDPSGLLDRQEDDKKCIIEDPDVTTSEGKDPAEPLPIHKELIGGDRDSE